VTPFGVDVRPPRDGLTLVVPRGELDLATAPELASRLDDLRVACAYVVLDLSALEFVDSAGLRVILKAREEAERHRTGLRLRAPSEAVRRACAVAGIRLEEGSSPPPRAPAEPLELAAAI
jgi:anti-sigma B factor antagonist